MLSAEISREQHSLAEQKPEMDQQRARAERELGQRTRAEAELDQQKRSVALLSKEVSQEQRSLEEQKELRASDIKVALDRLQSVEATNKVLVAKLARDSQAADAAARSYGQKVQALRTQAEQAASELSGRLEAAEA